VNLKAILDQTRTTTKTTSKQQQSQIALALLVFGAFMGLGAKYFDTTPVIGAVGTDLGIWILIAMLIAVCCRSAKAAALHVFLFFAGMLVAYYLYSLKLFGFFPKYYFMVWGGFALLSPICGWVAWYARGDGWFAAFCASLPIALLIYRGYSFYYTGAWVEGLDILSAIALFFILARSLKQKIRLLPLAAAAFLIFYQLNIISLLFGGL
jgi:hypothetical protein